MSFDTTYHDSYLGEAKDQKSMTKHAKTELQNKDPKDNTTANNKSVAGTTQSPPKKASTTCASASTASFQNTTQKEIKDSKNSKIQKAVPTRKSVSASQLSKRGITRSLSSPTLSGKVALQIKYLTPMDLMIRRKIGSQKSTETGTQTELQVNVKSSGN